MSLNRKICEVIKNPLLFWIFLANRGFFDYMDDEKYLAIRYRCILKRKLNINKPLSFNEKLQWLKIHDRKAVYESMVDKCNAKAFAASRIGENYIIPTYGVWDSFDDINFDALPNSFVVKCTHDSGGIVIVKDKSKINYKKMKSKINTMLEKNFYRFGREWPYKNLHPKIIIEEYLHDATNPNYSEGLIDYKFYCFNGIPKFLYISYGLDNHDTASISFVSLEWERLPFYRLDYKQFSTLPKKPNCFEEMISISKLLAQNTKFLRVDLYEVDNKVYFSEMTFYPCSGFMPFNDYKYDLEIGNYIDF